MKNYILTLLFVLVGLTSCEKNEYYYKTPGEINGEKIMEMVESGCKANCQISPHFYFDVSGTFTIEGQFLHVNEGGYIHTFDLNQLITWNYSSKSEMFVFIFDKRNSE